MKTLLTIAGIILLMLAPTILLAQAMLGYTFAEVKEKYPQVKFKQVKQKAGYSLAGEFECIAFAYFIYDGSDVVQLCMGIPKGMECLSGYVENYNEKYVILSKTSWRAYMESGFIMSINLEHDEESGYYFIYKSIE